MHLDDIYVLEQLDEERVCRDAAESYSPAGTGCGCKHACLPHLTPGDVHSIWKHFNPGEGKRDKHALLFQMYKFLSERRAPIGRPKTQCNFTCKIAGARFRLDISTEMEPQASPLRTSVLPLHLPWRAAF
eukprot:TRINITY_DN7268_c0_g1_i1.p1 TRINITY_DN7268_c0_g1~~TRINITY_DN7268_c0_g1_i1.p1  ORF type:complete len:130 (+),score=2.11 TRINITY_DN7268_c0_g1_i1:108-497(+)